MLFEMTEVSDVEVMGELDEASIHGIRYVWGVFVD